MTDLQTSTVRHVALVAEAAKRSRQLLMYKLFPDDTVLGPTPEETFYERSLYQKHLEFFRAGATHRERLAMMANRVGKTVMGGYETGLHLTGLYPHWWEGRRFTRPVRWWAAGKAQDTTRDIVQATLLGDIQGEAQNRRPTGTGTIPGAKLGKVTWKAGSVINCVDTIKVKHVSGGWSTLGFKAYSQGRGSFEGTAQHGVWCDEEPPEDVYGEIVIRTMTTNGLVLVTFTPLEGLSEVVKGFLGEELELMDREAA